MTETCKNDLLSAAQSGNEEALETLLAQFAPLRQSMASRYHARAVGHAEYDDFLQEANIAFLQALRTYNTAQSEVTFGLYAKICMRNRLVSKLRTWKGAPAANRHAKSLSADPAEKIARKERYTALLSQITCLLSKREMDVFRLYLLGKSYSEISLTLGITEKSVDNALFRLKAKLKKAGVSL